MYENIYKLCVLAVKALNTISLLTAYQAKLLEEMGRHLNAGAANPMIWEEICIISDQTFSASRSAVQSCGCAMGLAIVGQRSLWLNLLSFSQCSH